MKSKFMCVDIYFVTGKLEIYKMAIFNRNRIGNDKLNRKGLT